MELVIPIKKSKLDNIKLTESVDKQRVKSLLKYELLTNYTDEHGFKINEYSQLKKYMKGIKRNKISVSYRHSKNAVKVGRVFADQGLSLQLFRREIRHYLVYDTYTDIDIVNCYYSILYQLCQ